MANDVLGDSWDETVPGLNDARRLGQAEIRALRVGVRTRIEKEHILPAGSNAGMEHIAGSAMVYREASPGPTNRPDPITPTALTSADNGRLWVDSADEQMYVYVDPNWVAIPNRPQGDSKGVDQHTAIVTSGGWTNNTGELVIVYVNTIITSGATVRLEVEDIANAFQVVAGSVTIGAQKAIFASVLVPNGNAIQLIPAGGAFAGTAYYSEITQVITS